MIDLDFYAWREPVDGDDGPRLLVPLSDPAVHEIPADGVFAGVGEAFDYLADYGWEDVAAEAGWVLVRYRGDVVASAGGAAGAAGPSTGEER